MADIRLSDLYGKEIITNSGRKVGKVEDIILNLEDRCIANMLLINADELIRSERTAYLLAKNSVKYDRVKSVDQTIIVGEDNTKR